MVVEAEAVEDSAGPDEADERPVPALARAREIAGTRDDARAVAIAAAGGIVAGAATVAIAKAASRAAQPKRSRRGILGRQKQPDVIASRSFLVDVHLLGR
ncbi:hypothetical protein BH24ACT23_BH24ACT23_05020 [soil metagenome]